MRVVRQALLVWVYCADHNTLVDKDCIEHLGGVMDPRGKKRQRLYDCTAASVQKKPVGSGNARKQNRAANP